MSRLIAQMVMEAQMRVGRMGPDDLWERIGQAYYSIATIEAAAGHVSSLETEHGPADPADAYDCFDANSLPMPAGFNPNADWDLAAVRAALARRIREEIAAQSALREAGFSIGDRIQAGRGADHDIGRIIETIDSCSCLVAWESGVVTSCAIADMSAADHDGAAA